MLKVIEERWPQTEIYLCEWHLRHALERLLAKIAGETAEQLLPRTVAAFAGRHFWAAFDADARRLGDARLNAWLERWSPIIASQLSRRPRGKPDASDQPRSTGGLETFVKPIEAALYRRRYGMKNRERLNRLLLLLQLEANGHADERAYAKDIREWLEVTGGRPSTARRAITDPRSPAVVARSRRPSCPGAYAARGACKRRRHARDLGRFGRIESPQKPTRKATGGGCLEAPLLATLAPLLRRPRWPGWLSVPRAFGRTRVDQLQAVR